MSTTSSTGWSRVLSIPAAGGATISATEYAAPGAPADDAPTVVLAHGWTLSRKSWEPVIRALQAERNVRVVAYDQRGHGRSTWGSVKAQPIRELGNDLATVIAAVAPEGPLVLGGHSMGGMTIMAYAGQHPSAYADRVRGTVLVATSAAMDGRKPVPGEKFFMGIASKAPVAFPGLPLPKAMHRRMIFGENPPRDGVREATRQITRTKMATTGRYFHSLAAHDELASLEAVGARPTRVIVGTKDSLTPVRWSRTLNERIPGSELTVLPGKGHMLTYEATDVVVDALVEAIDRT